MAQAQGMNDTFAFAMLTVTSIASGAAVDHFGWQTINLYSIPITLLVCVGNIWMIIQGASPINTQI